MQLTLPVNQITGTPNQNLTNTSCQSNYQNNQSKFNVTVTNPSLM